MNFFQRIQKQLLKIEQRVPYIPNFSEPSNIGKILLVSFWICVIYSFSQIQTSSDFYSKFWHNVENFSPYLALQLLFLIFLSTFIKKIKPFFAILLIILNNLVCIYIIQSILNQSASYFFVNFEASMIQFYVSFGILFIFLIYFDWREKNLDPANHLAKLTFLQSKMKPHFLFNTINSIVSLIKKDQDTAKRMLLNLSELLRVSIKEEDITQLYALKEELNLCEKYLEIEKIRLGDRLNISMEIDPNCSLTQVPKLFLQPLIENSILHGIQNIEDGGTIEIKISKNLLGRVTIEIKNPINFENKKNKQSNKIALENIKERLNIYYDYNIIFKTTETKDLYYVYMEIPFLKA